MVSKLQRVAIYDDLLAKRGPVYDEALRDTRWRIDETLRKIDDGKKPLNKTECLMTHTSRSSWRTDKEFAEKQETLGYGNAANMIQRWFTVSKTDCCVICGSRVKLQRSHIGATRPELIRRAYEPYRARGWVTDGEVHRTYLELHWDDPIALQCARCHNEFGEWQKADRVTK